MREWRWVGGKQNLKGPVERQAAYVQGGIVSLNARLLTVDVLQARLSLEAVNGVVISQAHRVQQDKKRIRLPF